MPRTHQVLLGPALTEVQYLKTITKQAFNTIITKGIMTIMFLIVRCARYRLCINAIILSIILTFSRGADQIEYYTPNGHCVLLLFCFVLASDAGELIKFPPVNIL